jgi:DNA-binding transcriptional MerR regulator
MVGVAPYVLRFWETQFPFIRPRQARSRHRYYSQSDVQTLKMVKHLLHTQGYTIAGARRFVRENGLEGLRNSFNLVQPTPSGGRTKKSLTMSADSSSHARVTVTNGFHRALREIREDLRALHKLLETP